MMLIAREELILAVVEGSAIFWGGMFVLAVVYGMAEDIVIAMGWHKPRRPGR